MTNITITKLKQPRSQLSEKINNLIGILFWLKHLEETASKCISYQFSRIFLESPALDRYFVTEVSGPVSCVSNLELDENTIGLSKDSCSTMKFIYQTVSCSSRTNTCSCIGKYVIPDIKSLV